MPPAVFRYTHRKNLRNGFFKLLLMDWELKIFSSSGILNIVWQIDSMNLFSPCK
jgi:hypothetical protein